MSLKEPPRKSGRWPCRPRRGPSSVCGSPMGAHRRARTGIWVLGILEALPIPFSTPVAPDDDD
eukprot:8662031-Heterocapsa_arctica.AAC.1